MRVDVAAGSESESRKRHKNEHGRQKKKRSNWLLARCGNAFYSWHRKTIGYKQDYIAVVATWFCKYIIFWFAFCFTFAPVFFPNLSLLSLYLSFFLLNGCSFRIRLIMIIVITILRPRQDLILSGPSFARLHRTETYAMHDYRKHTSPKNTIESPALDGDDAPTSWPRWNSSTRMITFLCQIRGWQYSTNMDAN